MRYHESWPVAPIVLALLLAACTGHQGGRPAHTIAKARTAPPCRTAALTLGNGPTLVPMTSEHGDFYTLTNHGHRTCTLTGYPKVVLYDARGKPMPFHYAHQLRTYLSAITPAEATIAPGASADVLVVKYTCVLGALRNAATIRLTLPGHPQAVLTAPVARNGLGVSALSYCKGGPDYPRQTVAVSPIEPANAGSLWDRIRGLAPPPT